MKRLPVNKGGRGGSMAMIGIRDRVQVNIPFTWLMEGYLELFVKEGLHPEIGIDAQALDRYDDGDFQRVARIFLNRGRSVTLHAPFLDLAPGSPDPLVLSLTRKRLEQAVRLIPFFRPRTLVCHAGYDGRRYGGELRQVWLNNSLETWRRVADRIRGHGAMLVLENVYERGPEEMIDLFDALEGTGTRFCLDTGHLSAFGEAPADRWIEALGSRIGQLHLHDNGGEEDEHLALGDGVLDFPSILGQLARQLPSPPVVTLEPHREADLEPCLRLLEDIWPW